MYAQDFWMFGNSKYPLSRWVNVQKFKVKGYQEFNLHANSKWPEKVLEKSEDSQHLIYGNIWCLKILLAQALRIIFLRISVLYT